MKFMVTWPLYNVSDVEETAGAERLDRTTRAIVWTPAAATTNSSISIHYCWSPTSRPELVSRTRELRQREEPATIRRHCPRRRHHPHSFSAPTSTPPTPLSTRPAPSSAPLIQLPVQFLLPVAEFRPEEVTFRCPADGDLIRPRRRSSIFTKARNSLGGATGKPIATTMTSASGIPEVDWDARPVVRWFSAARRPRSSRRSNSVTVERQTCRLRFDALNVYIWGRSSKHAACEQFIRAVWLQ